MTEEQTTQLLMFLGKFWSNLSIDDDTIDAWHIVFCDEPYSEVVAAARSLVKASTSPFPPTPGMVLAEKTNLTPSTALKTNEAWTWFTSKSSRKILPPPSDHEKRAWELWGGDRRWGSLPDPQWAPNPADAAKVISFAKREFEELLKSSLPPRPHLNGLGAPSTDVVTLVENLTKRLGE